MAPAPPNKLPLWYRLFFLYIEPVSTVVGAYFAIFQQQQYLDLTHAPSSPVLGIPLGSSIALTQLGNLYLLFALSEGLVLRSTTDHKVWKALLFGMLVADFGHLWSVGGLGWEVYYDVFNYNAIDWGNVPFVYVGAATRIAFMLDVGIGSTYETPTKRGRPSKATASAPRR